MELLNKQKRETPDWLIDMIEELDYIQKDNPAYIPQFHGRLRGLSSKNFNIEAITQELLNL